MVLNHKEYNWINIFLNSGYQRNVKGILKCDLQLEVVGFVVFCSPCWTQVIHKMITYVQNLEEKDLKDKVRHLHAFLHSFWWGNIEVS